MSSTTGNYSEADILELFETLLNAHIALDDDQYNISVGDFTLAPISREELGQLTNSVNSYERLDETSVLQNNTFEVLVQHERSTVRLRREGMVLEDSHAGLKYSLGSPTDSYALFLLLQLTHLNNGRPTRPARGLPTYTLTLESRRGDEPIKILDILKTTYRMLSLHIESQAEQSHSTWIQRVDSFFFHLAYNIDVALLPQKSLEELIRPARISSVRRSRIGDLDAPQRSYIADLVYHYQLGVSAESPMLEFISYYHVLEHWFENVYQADLVETIQNLVTSPGFSYRRKRDIQDLIKKVSKAVQLRDEDLVINEQVALRLTLAKYVDVSQLIDDLNKFDGTLLLHYTSSEVEFSKGDRVNLQSSDTPELIGALSRRIYKTRNALVHSKDGLKSRFVPFSNDRDLRPEVPLIRFVAEQVIIATSKIH